MRDPIVEQFAREVVEHVRDRAVAACLPLLSPRYGDSRSVRWREAAASGDSEQLLREVIPDVADSAVFYLMDAIDNGLLHLAVLNGEGMTDLTDAGRAELAMEWAGGDWRVKYSKQPFNG